MTYSGEIGPMSVPNMQIACSALSKLGPTVCLEADDAGNSRGRGKYHVYLELHNREFEALQRAASSAGNNMAKFGEDIAKQGGEIAGVLADAAAKGVEIAIAVIAVLWTLVTGGGFQQAGTQNGAPSYLASAPLDRTIGDSAKQGGTSNS
jgi:hypothetical protein